MVFLVLTVSTKCVVSFDPANFDVSEKYEGNVQSSCHLAQLFLDTLAFILRKKCEIVEEIFSLALEMQFVRFH